MSLGKLLRSGLGFLLAGIVMFATGCDDDDGGSAEVGSITVQGNISDFDGGAAVAAGVKAGITVKLVEVVTDPETGETTTKETEYSTTTADDGTFVIFGIVAGTYKLVVSDGTTEVEYPLNALLANTRVEVTNVTVTSSGDVRVESVVRVDLGEGGSGTRTTLVSDEEEEEKEEENTTTEEATDTAYLDAKTIAQDGAYSKRNSLAASGVLWFKFVATSPGEIEAHVESGNPDIQIDIYAVGYDGTQQPVSTMDDKAAGFDEMLPIQVAPGKTYYFKVSEVGGAAGGSLGVRVNKG